MVPENPEVLEVTLASHKNIKSTSKSHFATTRGINLFKGHQSLKSTISDDEQSRAFSPYASTRNRKHYLHELIEVDANVLSTEAKTIR